MTVEPTPALEARDLRVHYPVGGAPWSRTKPLLRAVDGVTFDLHHAEILALVGESGSGKSTLARTLAGLERPTSGNLRVNGCPLATATRVEMRALRRKFQLIFQDPYASLNPILSVREIVAEPLSVHKLHPDRAARLQRVVDALEAAGMRPASTYLDKRPHELSGGQRQRVAIAAALVLDPQVLLADEPVSMLDVSVRAQILNLLVDLRATRGISVLYITHDLSTAAAIADRIAVMYLGRIVEIGSAEAVLDSPQHPYTKALLSAIPIHNPRQRRPRTLLPGDLPSPLNIPPGCRFHPRCPLAVERCKQIDPQLLEVAAGHSAACILVRETFHAGLGS